MNPHTQYPLPFLGRQGQQKRLSFPIIVVDEKEEVSKERNHSGVWTIKGPFFTSFGVLL
jgi:hypothetical protein